MRCPYCGNHLAIVPVHGHGQCARCGTTVEPCCAGQAPGEVADAARDQHLDAEPHLFARLFAQLGGEHATVTRDALELAYACRQGADLDEAREVIAAAQHLGILVESPPDCLRLA